ncbi:hypothetical protein ACRALDRAFT_1051018 [Sodiomyces alcalophilus JCM 7366]|uniref:uncharacterized protein n=1 Tax=Sodiomyces alcalophilus JCM 7366 TaxID=591952 RepID=UPI0039B41C75
MPLPLSIAVPAAAAGAAYLNARASLWYDAHLLQCIVPSTLAMHWRERTDRLNPFYVLERHARNKSSADRTSIIFEGKSYSYAQVYENVLKYGTWLREQHGVKPKDIVAMNFQNSELFIFVWFGLWSIGARPAFLNYNLSGNSLAHCIKTATASLVIVDPSVADNVTDDIRRDLGDVRFVVLTPELQSEIAANEPRRYPDWDRSESGYQNLAILISTSGTTGLPKAAVVSYGKLIVAASFSSRFLKIGAQDVFYTSMPLYHSSASLLGFLNVLEAGSTISLGRKFSTKSFWPEVRSSGATIIHYVGETCRYLLAAPPQVDPATGENLDRKHKVRAAFGNGLRPDVWNQFKERFGIEAIAEFYASTEGPLATWNYSRNDFAKGAVGRNGALYSILMASSLSLVEVDPVTYELLRDTKTGLCRTPKPGQPGEMLCHVPAKDLERRFQGYYGNPQATLSKVARDVFRKGDAWFRTGDLMRWDGEGRLFFHDRIGDTFRWKSENVSTQEVSEAVGSHPAVCEANVYGVELPHHDGRAGCAAIVLDEAGGSRLDEALLHSIATWVRQRLPRYAQPIFLRVMPPGTMETTSTNKQMKQGLREQGVNLPDGDHSQMFWLKGDTYVPFSKKDWQELNGGRVKL